MPEKRSSEEEYFARQEYEKRRALAEKKKNEMQAAEQQRLKEQHWMHCPKCGHDLLTVGLHSIEVDQCPHCNGLWLDAGELEAVIERDGGGPLKKLLGIFKS